jgi:DNA polymerase
MSTTPDAALADALRALGDTLRFHRHMGMEHLPMGGDVLRTPAEALALQERALQGCTRCKLSRGRTNLVFGTGHPRAGFMCIGEGPGADEDAQGKPFVGRAGQLLTKMLGAIHFSRDDVYIANAVKCRPPGNRNPEPDELEACAPFLQAQIALIQPKVVLALGSVATKALLRTTAPISALRGRVHPFGNAVLVPTFHPAYLLRSPDAKRVAWEDLQLARREYDRLTQA